MKRANHWLSALGLIVLSSFAQGAWALTCTSASPAAGDWKDAVWTTNNTCQNKNSNPPGPPANSNVVIVAGSIIKVDSNTAVVANVTTDAGVLGTGVAAGTLIINGDKQANQANTLTLSGNFVNNGITLAERNSTLSVGGNFTNNGTFTAQAGSTVAFTGTSQTITGNVTFVNLSVGANTVLTLAGNVIVTGTVTGTITLASTCPQDFTLTLANGTVMHSCGGAAAANFDCIETGAIYTPNPAAPARNPLYTKLAGTGFSFDVVALKANGKVETNYAGGGNNAVTVELVDTSAGGTCATYPALNPAVSQALTFTSADAGRKTAASMTVAKSYKSVACRVTDNTGPKQVQGCSADSFAIRTVSLSVSATGLGADTTGTSGAATPVVKAGTGFTLTATASDTGYTGTPSLDNAQLAAHTGAVRNGTLAGTFGAAVAGVSSGSAFTYDDAGYFMLNANGVVDTTFTAVDSAVGDCTADFSTALAGGQYGCKIGSAATVYFGRFIPDHFDTAVVATATTPMPCPTGLTCPVSFNGFVYSGQPFSVEVSARNTNVCTGGLPDACTTQNYEGTFAQAVTLSAAASKGGAVIATGGAGQPTIIPASVAGFGKGAATTTGAASPAFTFAAVATAPTDVYVRADDTDGVSSLRGASSVEGGVKVASGRIKISNAYGSELLPLAMTATVQYCSAVAGGNCTWTRSTTDSATTFDTNLSTAGGNLVAVIVSGLGGGVVVSGPTAAAVAAGDRTFNLAAPGVTGIANISLNTPGYLPSVAGRATFGVYRGSNTVIYRGRRGR